jgi:hypothetical protein
MMQALRVPTQETCSHSVSMREVGGEHYIRCAYCETHWQFDLGTLEISCFVRLVRRCLGDYITRAKGETR